jgi:hypothetical protein
VWVNWPCTWPQPCGCGASAIALGLGIAPHQLGSFKMRARKNGRGRKHGKVSDPGLALVRTRSSSSTPAIHRSAKKTTRRSTFLYHSWRRPSPGWLAPLWLVRASWPCTWPRPCAVAAPQLRHCMSPGNPWIFTGRSMGKPMSRHTRGSELVLPRLWLSVAFSRSRDRLMFGLAEPVQAVATAHTRLKSQLGCTTRHTAGDFRSHRTLTCDTSTTGRDGHGSHRTHTRHTCTVSTHNDSKVNLKS